MIRPAYAVLDNFILRLVNEYEMPDWKESLDEYLKEIKEG
jgi:dTDP-4-dehydrorhamnose reductase